MLVKKVHFNDFLKEFKEYGRGDSFSYEGKKALFEYLNELGDDIGEPIELDIIGICCEFSEFKNLKEFNNYYNYDLDSIEDIYYYTIVIPIDEKSFIIQDF